jgi:hypothetical protein
MSKLLQNLHGSKKEKKKKPKEIYFVVQELKLRALCLLGSTLLLSHSTSPPKISLKTQKRINSWHKTVTKKT